MFRHTVTLYSKPNCPLCDEALEQIEIAQAARSFELIEVNILADPKLYHRYQTAIPVVCLNGKEIFQHRLRAADLLRLLE